MNNDYSTYMQSEEWREKKSEVYTRVRRKYGRVKCEQCERIPHTPPHVHHLTYDRFGHEDLSDLVLLCEECHKAKHPERYRTPTLDELRAEINSLSERRPKSVPPQRRIPTLDELLVEIDSM